MAPEKRDKRDAIVRGVKKPNPVSTATFVGLRSLDVVLQYGILAKGLADPLLNALSVHPTYHTLAPAVALGLPLKTLIMLGMAAGTTLKQSFWITSISNDLMLTGDAIKISVFNTLFNSLNSILSITSSAAYFTTPALNYSSNVTGLSPLVLLGTFSYLLGMTLETTSEIQRKRFKDNPKNAGKPYTGGLYGLARHINYGGYVLMRGGYALAAGGWICGSIMGAFFMADFATRAVPVLDDYCTEREFIDLGSTILSAILNKAGTKFCTGKDVVLRASVCSAGVKLVVILGRTE
ncbi:membrane protein [Rutstroemia sp. NJR-2017a WRK4]|nr:membrane protein [Rutstroemia sp. NJR-2017a WRK4]